MSGTIQTIDESDIIKSEIPKYFQGTQ